MRDITTMTKSFIERSHNGRRISAFGAKARVISPYIAGRDKVSLNSLERHAHFT